MLNYLRNLSGSVAVLIVLVLLVGLFAIPGISRSGDWQQVTIVYTGDINGKIEPCG